MRRYFLMVVALVAVLAVAMPSFALEFKYGGMFRVRLQSTDNVQDGTDFFDDNQNYIDQRLRMYFTFVSSENLKVVTKWEADTVWGFDTGGRHGGGDVGADATNLEMKNAYLDFAIPNTPVRVQTGVQTLGYLDGWIIADDFSAAVAEAKFDPVKVTIGYIAALNRDVTDEMTGKEDDVYISVDYANGPFKASVVGFYQYAHSQATSIDPGLFGNDTYVSSNFNSSPATLLNAQGDSIDNSLFDLGISLQYKDPIWSAYINFVKNFGGFDSGTNGVFAIPAGRFGVAPQGTILADNDSYEGWMLEGRGNLYCGPFTFTLGGFYTTGSDSTLLGFDAAGNPIVAFEDFNNIFRYPAGVSHYWSEIMGLGTFDTSVTMANGFPDDRVRTSFGYASADHPSNLWMVNAGAAWQALEGTKLTLNYYYIGTSNDVWSGFDNLGFATYDSSIGHEFDMYIDQAIVDKLSLRLVGAYLIAEDAYTAFSDDNDAYEVGAQLLWSF